MQCKLFAQDCCYMVIHNDFSGCFVLLNMCKSAMCDISSLRQNPKLDSATIKRPVGRGGKKKKKLFHAAEFYHNKW